MSHDVVSYVTSFVVLALIFPGLDVLTPAFFHHFVRQLITFLPKEHTIYLFVLLFWICKLQIQKGRTNSARCGQLRYVFCGFFSLIFVILYVFVKR